MTREWKDGGGRKPDQRNAAADAIDAAMAVFNDPSTMALLPGEEYLVPLVEKALPKAQAVASKYAFIRLRDQSIKSTRNRGHKA